MSYICDLFFIFSLDFIVINYITLLKQTHLFLYIFWNISYYFLIITYIRKMNNFPIANVQHQGVAELLLNFLPVLAWRSLLKKRVLKYVYLKNEMFLVLQSTSAISNTRYLELSLCRTFYLVPSAFSLTSLINPFGISNSAISNFHYVEDFFSIPSVIFGLFPIRYLEHSNEVCEWIILFIWSIRMLVTALIQLCREVFFIFYKFI